MLLQTHASPIEPGKRARDFYVDALRSLDDARLPYAVGGGYAMAYYTGIRRNTKDLDIFVKASDHRRILRVLKQAGYRTEYFYPFWIAKALNEHDDFIDILYSSGNGQCAVDDEWFAHSTAVQVLGYPTRLVPAEEQLWSKAFVQDRDRFDGADVNHLVLRCGQQFDWRRLLRRFAGHEGVLLAHLTLFRYAYPSDRRCVPDWVMNDLRAAEERDPAVGSKVCRGTNISQKGYLTAVRQWGYADARLKPHGPLTRAELAQLPDE